MEQINVSIREGDFKVSFFTSFDENRFSQCPNCGHRHKGRDIVDGIDEIYDLHTFECARSWTPLSKKIEKTINGILMVRKCEDCACQEMEAMGIKVVVC